MSGNTRRIPTAWLGTIRDDVSFAEYRELDGINAHGLMDMLKSPGAYRAGLSAVPQPPSPSMTTGILFETALLEPKRYLATVEIGSSRESREGKTMVTPATFDKISMMVESVLANPHAMDAIQDIEVQPTLLWKDRATGVACKARPDAIAKFGDKRVLVDIKTARGASAADFSRAAAQYYYDLQAAHYLDFAQTVGHLDADTFLFIVVQNTAPHSCFVYEASAQMLARGRAWRENAMGLYASCRQNDDWPSEPAFQTLDLPKWAPWPREEQPQQVAPEDGLSDPPDLD